MNHAKKTVSKEILAGAIVSVVQYFGTAAAKFVRLQIDSQKQSLALRVHHRVPQRVSLTLSASSDCEACKWCHEEDIEWVKLFGTESRHDLVRCQGNHVPGPG
jgi:hypothetical protein